MSPLPSETAGDSAVSKLATALITGYESEPAIGHLPTGRPPNRDVIVSVLSLLRELLFPDHYGPAEGCSMPSHQHVCELLTEIRARLVGQVQSALIRQGGLVLSTVSSGGPTPNTASRAEHIVAEFLATLPRLRATLATDVMAAFDGDPAAGSTDEIILSYPGFFATVVYRIAHEFYRRGVPLIPRMLSEYAHGVTGIDIHPGATIGAHFFIDHGTGVVIGETTVIGQRVKIYQSVTLGALSTRGGQKLRGQKRHPTLEDEVTVYSGASILGGETVVGRGAVIGSNVFVTRSVPPGTRVTVKSPELHYRDQLPRDFHQELPAHWDI